MPPSNGSNLARRGEIPSSIAHETSKFRIVENRQPMTTPLLLEPCCSDTFSETYGPSNRNALLPFPDLRRSFRGGDLRACHVRKGQETVQKSGGASAARPSR